MNTWKVILATMVIFGTGVITGGLLVRQTSLKKPARSAHGEKQGRATPASPNSLRMEFLRRVEREFDLTPEQHDKIDKILSASQERTKKIMEPVNPRIKEEMQATREAVRTALTPEQRARFDELVKAQLRPRDAKRGKGGAMNGTNSALHAAALTNSVQTNAAPAQP